MNSVLSADIRNIAVVGHSASGKTMLCESMLACSGVINRLGRINNGNTISDYHEDEHKQLHSIYTSVLTAPWHNKKFNLLDTPGYMDFIGETLGALHVADMAAIVISAQHGIEIGTEKMLEYARQHALPYILIVNGVDKEEIKLNELTAMIKEQCGSHVVPMSTPLNAGPHFNQVLDIVQQKILTYAKDELGTHKEEPISGNQEQIARQYYTELAECVAESDDKLLETFFANATLNQEQLKLGIHNAFTQQLLVPLFYTSSELNIGLTPVMNFFADFGVNPLEHTIAANDEQGQKVTIKPTENDPALFIFKTVTESKSGGLSLFRTFSGTLKPGLTMHNSARRSSERVGQLFCINGKDRTPIEVLAAGDIGATAKLKDSHTNNTLCDPHHIITFAPIAYPRENITIGLRSKNQGDEEKIATGLSTIHEEDPTCIFKMDAELHQMLLAGQGELHVETAANKLRHRFGLELETFAPRIHYRETIKAKADAKYRHKKQSGGAGQFAEVWMRIEPKDRDSEVEFTQSLVGQNVDRVFVPSVEKGVKAACEKGALAGYRVVAVKVDFYDGKQHPVDSKDIAFQIAGKFAFKEAFLKAKPCLLEPIDLITVKVPEEFTGEVMSDLSSRRGKILGIEAEGKFQVIKAHVPESELYRYSTTLRSLVGGRGIHTQEFGHYEEVPHELEERIVAAHKQNTVEEHEV